MTMTSARYLSQGLSILSTLSTPLHYIIDASDSASLCLTHKVCNIEALQIIRENGYHEVACILEKNINSLQLGVTWADLEFKNINHFFNPITRKGLWRFSPAVYDFSVYLTKACRFVKNKDLVNGFFYLGASAHLLQDMAVPHHVCGHLFNGHKKFENWVQTHNNEFSSLQIELIPIKKPLELLLNNAILATDFMPLVDENATINQYHFAAQALLPIAHSSSATLFEWFISTKILSQH
ncbi:zinc dependent phospholipase C family protein [Propionispira raffinosivorans]|uniref:zinc dependent phospholipase C family protein n=1 Tax=Propionispira raffinosivorans TaxID=86959 RepID=UPI00036113E5|nr:zinc dependent phospholipase C family protein [Propionispira raffinosivorans]